MAKLWEVLRGSKTIERYSLEEYFRQLSSQYTGLTPPTFSSTVWRDREDPENSFVGYTIGAYKSDSIVFACMMTRQQVFSEARFQFRQIRNGRPGDLFGSSALGVLERPWPNGTTGELLARMIQDVDLAGNFYAVNEGDRLRRLRPDWVTISLSAPPEEAVESDVIGYAYWPGGIDAGTPVPYTVDEVVHWSPIPDPTAQYRGMSWLTPIIREILADRAYTDHKLKFLENGATLGPIFRLPESMTAAQFKEFVKATDTAHRGVQNAYKPMYVGGGADITLAAADFRQLDFKAVQGAGESRIAAAARVHPVLVGLSEGLQGSSLNAGNYGAAKRNFADGTLRPLWRGACAALATVVQVPSGAELWFDDRDIAYLREDAKDVADIQSAQAAAIRQLVDAGYEADSVVQAILADDMALLKHSGLFSVQLQEPGAQDQAATAPADAQRATLDEELEELLRAWSEENHRRDSKGRFSSTGGKVAAALESGVASALDGMNREQLRREAKKRGLTLRRGAPIDEIKDMLWDHHHESGGGKSGSAGDDRLDWMGADTPGKGGSEGLAAQVDWLAEPDVEHQAAPQPVATTAPASTRPTRGFASLEQGGLPADEMVRRYEEMYGTDRSTWPAIARKAVAGLEAKMRRKQAAAHVPRRDLSNPDVIARPTGPTKAKPLSPEVQAHWDAQLSQPSGFSDLRWGVNPHSAEQQDADFLRRPVASLTPAQKLRRKELLKAAREAKTERGQRP